MSDKFVQQDEGDQERAFQRAFTLEAILNAGLFVVGVPDRDGVDLATAGAHLVLATLEAVAVDG